MTVLLTRRAYLPHVTIGVLTVGPRTWVTLEPPWKDNESNVSCIPDGQYELRRRQSQRFGETFEIHGVPKREAILFHAGNRANDTQGCVLLGTWLSEDTYAIGSSKIAIKEFMECLSGADKYHISIVPFAGAKQP